METSTRYKCAQLLLMVREHMRIARPVNESEILDKMEAFLRFPLLAPDFHECSECSDQPCSCCNNAPKQGEWNLTAGSPVEARLRNQDWDGNTGTWVRSFENGQHLFIPDVEPKRYQLADDIRPLEKSLDEKLCEVLTKYRMETTYSIEEALDELKSLFAVKMPALTEVRDFIDGTHSIVPRIPDEQLFMTLFQHFNNQNQGR